VIPAFGCDSLLDKLAGFCASLLLLLGVVSVAAAAATAGLGAVLAFIGLIHASKLGWAAAPDVALGYALFALICVWIARQPA
jgi:hypothetical protein